MIDKNLHLIRLRHMRRTLGARQQRGAVLFISLVMLVVLLLFVAAMVSSTSSEFMAQRNIQAREEMERAGLEAIEIMANVQQPFLDAAAGTGEAITYTVNGYDVEVSSPVCYSSGTLAYSALSTVASEDTFFDVTATVSDTTAFSSTQVQVTQGFRIRMPAGSCTTFAVKSPNT